MIPISKCSEPGCGLRVCYRTPSGETCWLHADKQKLPAHQEWKREYAAFLRSNPNLVAAATKRDDYGILGR